MPTKPVTCYLEETADVSKYILRLTRLERQAEIRKLLSAGFQVLYQNNSHAAPALTIRSQETPAPTREPASKTKSVALTNLSNL